MMNPEIGVTALRGVPESLLLPLYFRAVETGRPKPVIVDHLAAALVRRIDYDFSRIRERSMDQLFAVLRTREFDRRARAFLSEHPKGVLVDIGCGFDTRFQRLDDGQVRWFGLDLPDVIMLRRKLIPETNGCQLFATAVQDVTWMNLLEDTVNQPILFLAEGVLPYLRKSDVKNLVIALSRRFPRSELVFDAMSGAFIRLHNVELAIRHANFRLGWGIKDARELESWASGIRLLRTWYYFDDTEVLVKGIRVLRHIPALQHGAWVAHFALASDSKPAGKAE